MVQDFVEKALTPKATVFSSVIVSQYPVQGIIGKPGLIRKSEADGAPPIIKGHGLVRWVGRLAMRSLRMGPSYGIVQAGAVSCTLGSQGLCMGQRPSNVSRTVRVKSSTLKGLGRKANPIREAHS